MADLGAKQGGSMSIIKYIRSMFRDRVRQPSQRSLFTDEGGIYDQYQQCIVSSAEVESGDCRQPQRNDPMRVSNVYSISSVNDINHSNNS